MDAAVRQPKMRWHQKLAYSFGHIENDLCATMWFSLLLIFLQYVVLIPEKTAGYLLLWGQIVDAVSTPLVGYESDRINGCFGLAKRKSWHLLGTIAVSISFPFVFLRCLACMNVDTLGQAIYYAPFIAIFQFGWSCTQISHMALMSQLTQNRSEQTELSGLRNAGSLLSRVVVFCAGWAFFGPDSNDDVTPADKRNFMMLMVTVIVIGIVFSGLFQIFLREINSCHSEQQNHSNQHVNWMEWYDWLKEPQFYLMALLYMLSRLIVNVSGTYWPFYIIKTLHLNKQYMVIIPLIVNVTGFFFSLLMRPISDKIGRKVPMLLGIVITGGGCVWLWAITHFHAASLQVIGPSILIGIGGSALIVTSLAMTTDMIGPRSESGAFVFGLMSLTDKLANGVAVLLIQLFCPCSGHTDAAHVANYYNIVMVYVIAAFCIVQCLALFLTWPQNLGQLRKAFPVPVDGVRGLLMNDESDTEPLIASINRTPDYMSTESSAIIANPGITANPRISSSYENSRIASHGNSYIT